MRRKPRCEDLLGLVKAALFLPLRCKRDGNGEKGRRKLLQHLLPCSEDRAQIVKHRHLSAIFQCAQKIADAGAIVRQDPDARQMFRHRAHLHHAAHADELPRTRRTESTVLDTDAAGWTTRREEEIEKCRKQLHHLCHTEPTKRLYLYELYINSDVSALFPL